MLKDPLRCADLTVQQFPDDEETLFEFLPAIGTAQ